MKNKYLKSIIRLFYITDDDFIEKWKKTHDKGLIMYLLKVGVPYCLFLIAVFLLMVTLSKEQSIFGYKNEQMIIAVCLYSLLLSSINNILTWVHNNKKYEVLTNQ